jgi:DNA-binding GntR family transcriptional regulator
MAMDLDEVHPARLSDQAYSILRSEILSGTLPPGHRLKYGNLAGRFSVSISPVRDAVQRLASEGLVKLIPRRGAVVTEVTPKLVAEVYQIREMIECAALSSVVDAGQQAIEALEKTLQQMAATTVGDSHSDYLAYINLDESFHQSIVSCVGNSTLSELYAHLRSHTIAARVLNRAPDQRASQTLDEHAAIVTALRSGNLASSQQALRIHLGNARDEIIRRLPAGHE